MASTAHKTEEWKMLLLTGCICPTAVTSTTSTVDVANCSESWVPSQFSVEELQSGRIAENFSPEELGIAVVYYIIYIPYITVKMKRRPKRKFESVEQT